MNKNNQITTNAYSAYGSIMVCGMVDTYINSLLGNVGAYLIPSTD